MELLIGLVAAAMGYLLGSISFARVVTGIVAPGRDISVTDMPAVDGGEAFQYRAASATAVSIQVGPRYGCLTSVLDMLKVALPVLGFRALYPETPYFLLTAFMGVVGHNWPIYYGFQGGRGMSPLMGGMLVIDWLGLLVTSVLGMMLGLGLFRDILLAYTGGAILLIPWLWWRTGDWRYVAYAVGINIALFVATRPEFKAVRRLKEEGFDLAELMQSTPMSQGTLKIARRLGLLKEKN